MLHDYLNSIWLYFDISISSKMGRFVGFVSLPRGNKNVFELLLLPEDP